MIKRNTNGRGTQEKEIAISERKIIYKGGLDENDIQM